MKKQNDFKSAISLTEDARLNALRAKRDAGDLHNPFCAKSGREAEYYKAAQSVQACDLILKVLKKEKNEEAWKKARTVKRKAKHLFTCAMDVFVMAGLIALACMGFAAVTVLFKFYDPIIQAASVIGASAALAAALCQK